MMERAATLVPLRHTGNTERIRRMTHEAMLRRATVA